VFPLRVMSLQRFILSMTPYHRVQYLPSSCSRTRQGLSRRVVRLRILRFENAKMPVKVTCKGVQANRAFQVLGRQVQVHTVLLAPSVRDFVYGHCALILVSVLRFYLDGQASCD
jgi:hypothetical protein